MPGSGTTKMKVDCFIFKHIRFLLSKFAFLENLLFSIRYLQHSVCISDDLFCYNLTCKTLFEIHHKVKMEIPVFP